MMKITFVQYLLCLATVSACASSAGTGGHAHVARGSISTDTPIHVHPFSTAETDLGGHAARDIANTMVRSAPHLLAVDIVDGLRAAGFTNVTLDESEGEPSASALKLTGRFTVLKPGSQNLRLWIGFGAGKSKVCVEGQLANPQGGVLADFSMCRGGLGWGASGPQLEGETGLLGHSIADSVIDLSGAGK